MDLNLSQIKSFIEKISSLGNPSIVGLDIGASGVKVCELEKSGKGFCNIKNFGFAPLNEGVIIDEEIQDQQAVIDAINLALKSSKIKSKNICYGLGGNDTVVRKMKAPEGSPSEIVDHITWESEQFIPFGIDNAEIGVHLMEKKDPTSRDVIMAAAKTETCNAYLNLFKASGFNTKVIDLQALALINIFEHNYADQMEEYEKGTLIIDFGAQFTKLIMYKDGAPLMAKWLHIGGITVTEEIQKEIGLSFEEAENLKFSKTGEENYPAEVMEVIKRVVDKTILAISDAVNIFNNQSSQDKINYCLICGGSVQLPGMIEALHQIFDVSIEVLDPFKKITVKSTNITQELLDQVPFLGAVSLGLALRSFDKNKL